MIKEISVFQESNFEVLLKELDVLLDKDYLLVDKEKYESFKAELSVLVQLKYAFDQSVIIGITDETGRILYVNEWFCKVSKYKKEELVGQNHRILNSGYHSKEFFKEMWDVIAAGEKWEGEIKNQAKDGSEYWVKTSIIPLIGESGSPESYISIRSDITEGKLAQEDLYRALQEDYRKTVHALDNMIFKVQQSKDGKFHFTLFAGKLAERLGYANKFFLNKTPEALFEKDQADYINKHFEKAFEGKSLYYRRKIDEKTTLLVSLAPIIKDNEVVEIVGSGYDITELEEAYERMDYLASHDISTSLPNKKKFDEDIKHYTKESIENNRLTGLLCIKVNGLQEINELFGSSYSERLFKKIGLTLNQKIEHYGELYRTEGSRFLFIVPSLEDTDLLKNVAKTVKNVIEEKYMIDEHEFKLSCDIGSSVFPNDKFKEEDLEKNAYIAMRYAQSSKLTNYLHYTNELSEVFEERIQLEKRLRDSILQNELELYYQPKFDISTGKVVGMEALLRWNLPDLGFVSPGKFIPLAEETGLIYLLGEWVLTEACRQNKKWIEKGYAPLKIAVNVSPMEIQYSGFTSKLEGILRKSKLDPSYLEIEITESVLMEDTDHIIKLIEEVRNMGVSIAIDDFGTGYSSLGYLKKFSVNTLKIDQSFIKDVLISSNDNQLVQAMINIAHIFNLTVVAEGVETKEVLELLKEYKCEQVQGFYYSKPLPSAEFEEKYLKN